MDDQRDWLTPGGHLNEEACALWAEALHTGEVNNLPATVIVHGESCVACKQKILSIARLSGPTDNTQKPSTETIPFPFPPARCIPGYFKVAAGILLLIGMSVAFFFLMPQKKKTGAILFAEYFNPYPDIVTVKGSHQESAPDAPLFMLGLNEYNHARYDSARIVFNHLYTLDPHNDTLGFYLANILLASDPDPAAAIPILQRLSDTESHFAEAARWYLALAFVKKENYPAGRDLLRQLTKDTSGYKKNAEKLLREIK